MKKVKIEDQKLEEEIDRKARKVVRKGIDHEEHLPRYGMPLDDSYLKSTLQRRLSSNPLFDSSSVTIEVNSGEVIIHGKISDSLQKDFLLEFIRNEEGVRSIEDHTTVEHQWMPRRRLDPEVSHDYD